MAASPVYYGYAKCPDCNSVDVQVVSYVLLASSILLYYCIYGAAYFWVQGLYGKRLAFLIMLTSVLIPKLVNSAFGYTLDPYCYTMIMIGLAFVRFYNQTKYSFYLLLTS